MGGAKKPSPAKQEKSQGGRDQKKTSKKDKGESGPKKAEITVMVNGQQAMKIIQGAKVITAYDLARQMGVKISAVNAFLQDAQKSRTVKKVGGYSGHYIYQPAAS